MHYEMHYGLVVDIQRDIAYKIIVGCCEFQRGIATKTLFVYLLIFCFNT